MEDFIEKYSKWFPYCEKEKLKEQMRHDLSVMAEPTNEDSGLCLRCARNNEVAVCGLKANSLCRFRNNKLECTSLGDCKYKQADC